MATVVVLVKRIVKKPQDELTAYDNSTLNPHTEPVARVKPGETVEVETWDAYGGVVSPERTFQQAVEDGAVAP